MILKSLSDGSLTGVGLLTVARYTLGGVLITADGTNNATVIIRKDDANGKQIFKLVTKSPQMIAAPISTEGAANLYYDISGTGGAAQIYEWIE